MGLQIKTQIKIERKKETQAISTIYIYIYIYINLKKEMTYSAKLNIKVSKNDPKESFWFSGTLRIKCVIYALF